MSVPRESTDLESAPLLANEEPTTEHQQDAGRTSLLAALTDKQRETTAVEKLLMIIAFIFLAIAATFIGLFAAERHRNTHAPPHTPEGPSYPTVSYSTITPTATATATPTSSPVPRPTPSACLTPDCVQLSAAILASLDTSVDPCEDFYSFSSGGWQKANPLPKDKGRWGSFNELAKANQRIVLDILEAPIPQLKANSTVEQEAELANLRKLHAEFNGCMAEDRLAELGSGPLETLWADVRALFPADYPTPRKGLAEGEAHVDVGLAEEAVARVKSLLAGAKDAAQRLTGDLGFKALDEGAKDLHERGHDGGKKGAKFAKELTDTLAYVHSIGVDALFAFNLEGDAAIEPQRQILWLYQDGLSLPSKEYYKEKAVTAVYESVLAGILEEAFNAEHTSASLLVSAFPPSTSVNEQDAHAEWEWPHMPWDPAPDDEHKPKHKAPSGKHSARALAKQVAKDVLAFEKRLARAQADPEKLFNPSFSYNPVSFTKLRKALPFDLASYVGSFAPRNFPEKIIVSSPEYVKAMSKLVEEEEDYVLQSYFLVRVALKYAKNLGDVPVRRSAEQLSSLLSGVKAQLERSEFCIAHTRSVLGHLTGAEFAARAFGGESKAKAEGIINSIIDEFKHTLAGLSWMDKKSSEAAIRKAGAITPKVGYPFFPNASDPVALRNYYARLEISEDDFFGNAVRTNKLELMRDWQAGLGNLRNRDSWDMYADEVNAYESPADNEIVFPAGILQPVFYSVDWPAYLNYGAFGAVAAHELGHAFDNSGAQYDDEGRFRQWWTNGTVAAFQERAQCIAKQYSKFYVLGPDGEKVHVQGNLTNGEDIGDSGLRVAWNAWKRSLASLSSSSSTELKLPGLAQYTDEQLFFLAYGRIWANNVSPQSAKNGVLTDPHSPNRFRVEGTLRNFEQFAETWQCKEGARMNPKQEERCALW